MNAAERLNVSSVRTRVGVASVLVLLSLAGVVVVVRDSANRHATTTNLNAEFAGLEKSLPAAVGLAVHAVGAGDQSIALGHWRSGPAWSTIKVPLAIAGLRAKEPPEVTDAMRAAITRSDNVAAESIWQSLGPAVTAARRVEAVLRETGDPTVVQSRKVRPEFTAFGQTDWPLTDQVRFAALAACDKRDAPIFGLMSQIEPDQRWGIGTNSGARFKGGWGPSLSGKHLVRQFGVLTTAAGMTAVALAAQPVSGSFDDGTQQLTRMAAWLTAHLAELPTGNCGR